MAVLFKRGWIRTMEMLDARLRLKWDRWWGDLLQVGLAQISQQIFNFVQSFWHCLIQNLMVGFVSERLSQNYGDVKLLGGFSLRWCCSEVFNCAMHNRFCAKLLSYWPTTWFAWCNGVEWWWVRDECRIDGCLYGAPISQLVDEVSSWGPCWFGRIGDWTGCPCWTT